MEHEVERLGAAHSTVRQLISDGPEVSCGPPTKLAFRDQRADSFLDEPPASYLGTSHD